MLIVPHWKFNALRITLDVIDDVQFLKNSFILSARLSAYKDDVASEPQVFVSTTRDSRKSQQFI